MQHDLATLHLSVPEMEMVAADLISVWTGATGQREAPALSAVTELVTRTLRKSRAVVAAREEGGRG
ncbi:hypothetical protein [Novosphingobium sp. PhB165]|uniref:hypothetical protein n=1 Tax=Novosphingobium sp. PhB165 TaxID=2485105 RepID=UPI001051DE4A|nr:hypothetical protein [Novosphingobium sp. PhB165]